MKKLYIHIGLYKTGTSFLQAQIFPNLIKVNYIDVRSKKLVEFTNRLTGSRLNLDELEKIHSVFNEEIKEGENLISDESLSGDAFLLSSKDRTHILRDLKEVFNEYDVKIILGIREQSAIITSLYKQYLHEGGTYSFNHFLKKFGGVDNEESTFFNLYNYSAYIDEIKTLFGNDCLYVYIFENLKRDKEKFLSDLLGFMGENKTHTHKNITYNRGYGSLQIKLARFLNLFFKSKLNPKGLMPEIRIPNLGRISPRLILQNRVAQKFLYRKYSPSEKFTKLIKEKYREDNKKIEDMHNIKLTPEYL